MSQLLRDLFNFVVILHRFWFGNSVENHYEFKCDDIQRIFIGRITTRFIFFRLEMYSSMIFEGYPLGFYNPYFFKWKRYNQMNEGQEWWLILCWLIFISDFVFIFVNDNLVFLSWWYDTNDCKSTTVSINVNTFITNVFLLIYREFRIK